MTKIFYDHLIVREEIVAEIDKHDLSAMEREELIALIDENIHHQILDLILTHLPAEKHVEFLQGFHRAPHDEQILEYLKKEIDADIEHKIAEEAKKIKKELLAEIIKSGKTRVEKAGAPKQ